MVHILESENGQHEPLSSYVHDQRTIIPIGSGVNFKGEYYILRPRSGIIQ